MFLIQGNKLFKESKFALSKSKYDKAHNIIIKEFEISVCEFIMI